jgi:outer membrane biosynthesis protein TonB
MRRGVTYSAVLHLAVFLFAWLGLPHFMSPPPEISEPVPVEVVTIAEKTSVPKAEPKPQPQQKPEPPKKAEPLPPAPPLPPQKTVEQPKPPEPPKPEPPKPEQPQVASLPQQPEPEPQPKPKPEKKPEAATPPAPTPIVQQPPKEKPKPPPPVASLDSILKSVEKIKPRSEPDQAQQVIKRLSSATPQHLASPDAQMTISEKDALRRQIERCWNVPAGAKNAKDLKIEIKVALNPDGSVQGDPSISDMARYGSDDFFRAAADSARRAVLVCQPYQLPPEKYSAWRDVTLIFDPSQML